MEGPVRELQEKAVGGVLRQVEYHEDTGWVTLVFDTTEGAIAWSVVLDAAMPIKVSRPR